jgi:hypothetical protein
MIRESDLDAAVSQNIINAEQAAKLRALAQERIRRPHGANERFVVVNNLAELFVSIGQVLFFIALFIAVGSLGPSAAIALPIAGIIAGWAMAEFFARYRNMRWPAIVASMAAAICAGWLTLILSDGWSAQRFNESLLTLPALVATASLGLAIWRYRLPFLALPFAYLLAAYGSAGLPWPRELSFVAVGAAALILAIALDLRDRERMTRNSAFAFWLYVAGAPLFLHPIYSSLTAPGQTTMAIVSVLLVAGISCILGLLLDRRSPIVASLIYLGVIIAWSAQALALSPQIQTALTLFILGVGVMLLGVWWKQARAAVLGVLPSTLSRRLPLTEAR